MATPRSAFIVSDTDIEPTLESLMIDIRSSTSHAFYLRDASECNMYITLERLTDFDIALVRHLLLSVMQNKFKEEKIIIDISFRMNSFDYSQHFSIQDNNFDKFTLFKKSLESIKNLWFINPKINVIFLSLFDENELPTQLEYWIATLCDAMKSILASNTDLSDKLDNLLIQVKFLCDYRQDKWVSEKLIPLITVILIKYNRLDKLLPWIEESNMAVETILEMNGKPHYFLNEAIKYQNQCFETLLKLLHLESEQDFSALLNLEPEGGNNILHYCNNMTYLEKFYCPINDINEKNVDGNTALHLAACDNNKQKARYLIIRGADVTIKNNKGETFFTVSANTTNHLSELDNALSIYREYNNFGKVLKSPLSIIDQKGPTCGFYAVASAASHHRDWHPLLFTNEPLPAKKNDYTPKALLSLRELRKKHHIPGVGGLYKAAELQKIIAETECHSIAIDIDNYTQFMDVIEKAISQNLPVIIPFASDPAKRGQPNLSLAADTAHWATIIGWAASGDQAGVLLSQYGSYNHTDAKELFKSFYDIELIFPGLNTCKKRGQDWQLSDASITPTEDIKTYLFPTMNLSEFRRKLIIVLPPKCELSAADFVSSTAELSVKLSN